MGTGGEVDHTGVGLDVGTQRGGGGGEGLYII